MGTYIPSHSNHFIIGIRSIEQDQKIYKKKMSDKKFGNSGKNDTDGIVANILDEYLSIGKDVLSLYFWGELL